MKTRLRKHKRSGLTSNQDMMRGMIITALLIFALVFGLAYLFPPPTP